VDERTDEEVLWVTALTVITVSSGLALQLHVGSPI
jgi:hypothetical protein